MEDSGQNQLASMAVGIILVLLAASVAFMIYRAGHGLATNATTKVTELGNTLDTSTIVQYDGETITGSQLLSWLTQVNGQDIQVVIDNGGSTVSPANDDFNMIDDAADIPEKIRGFRAKGDDTTYLNPKALYLCTVEYNGSIPTTVTFTCQNV